MAGHCLCCGKAGLSRRRSVAFHSPVAAISATATLRTQIGVDPIMKVCPDQAVSTVIPRVSSTDQNLDIQEAVLKSAGYEVIRSEKRSGTSRPLAD
jgi:hypothetical protein